MKVWRLGLFTAILLGTLGGWGWMFLSANGQIRGSLGLLAGVFAVGSLGVFAHYRTRLSTNLVTAYLAMGSIVHTVFAGLVVAGDRLGELGVLPAFAANWHHFLIGGLGVVAAFLTWTRARGVDEPLAAPSMREAPEPAPPPTPELVRPPDYDAVAVELDGDPRRLRQLRALRRLTAVLQGDDADGDKVEQAARIVGQEVMRLEAEAAAEAKEAEEDDVLSQAANLLEWGAQKLPELAELDVSDLLMAKAIADIRAQHSEVEHIFVDHQQLRAIHPIDRQTADDKCNERAEAARAALPVLRANSMRLSEELIAAHEELAAFRSVTGFQVVAIDNGYVTFEGNGRREALRRAFGDEGVQVEVRLFHFADAGTESTIRRRVERVRRWKNVVD